MQLLLSLVCLQAVARVGAFRPVHRLPVALSTGARGCVRSLSVMTAASPAAAAPVVASSTPSTGGAWDSYVKFMDAVTTLFPVWTVLFAGIALKRPQTFDWFTTKYFTASLGALMLSMGITLSVGDFKRVVKQPNYMIVGFLLCYALMPALGLGLGKAFKLPVDLIAGLILVGSINGGQASNLCTYIARGDVALSGNT